MQFKRNWTNDVSCSLHSSQPAFGGLSGKCRPPVAAKQRFILIKTDFILEITDVFFRIHFYDFQVNLLDNKPGHVSEKEKRFKHKISHVMNTKLDLWKHLAVRRALMLQLKRKKRWKRELIIPPDVRPVLRSHLDAGRFTDSFRVNRGHGCRCEPVLLLKVSRVMRWKPSRCHRSPCT